MAKSPQTPGTGVNPVYMMIGLGIGVALIIAIVIAAIETPTGEVVSPGPERDILEPSEVDETGVAEPADVATEDETADPVAIDGATAVDEAASDSAVVPMSDGEQSIAEGEGETPAGEEPAQDLSGSAVDPDDTGGLVTPTGEPADLSGVDTAIPSSDQDGTAEGGTDLDTSVIVDPDSGDAADGEVDSFNPTPSGPEGADGDPFSGD